VAHAAGDAHEFVIYGAHYRISFPILDADGDLVTAAAALDSEVSQDGGTFADCSNEATELATSSGMYYLDLIGTETDCKQLAGIVKTTTSGAKTTPFTLYPNRLPILESGVAEAGAASTITLAVASASAKDDFYNGCYVFISDNDAAGSQYQVRKIIDYVGSTRVCTIDSAWGTNPSSSSNYDILVPPGMAVVQWAGGKIADPTTAGVPEVDVTHWIGTAAATPTVAGVPEVDVTHWIGSAAATPTVAGVPEVDVTHWIGTAAATPTVAGVPEVDVTHLVGVAQSATDLKDFADDGYDPATNKVEGVKTADALTANNDKTGYALTSGERDSIGTALLDLANGVESGFTLRQTLRLMGAALCGKASGGPGSSVFRNLQDSADRIAATADSSGNRSAMTLTP